MQVWRMTLFDCCKQSLKWLLHPHSTVLFSTAFITTQLHTHPHFLSQFWFRSFPQPLELYSIYLSKAFNMAKLSGLAQRESICFVIWLFQPTQVQFNCKPQLFHVEVHLFTKPFLHLRNPISSKYVSEFDHLTHSSCSNNSSDWKGYIARINRLFEKDVNIK